MLVLNYNYEPLSVCNVRKAICLIFLGKAEVIESYDGKRIRSVSISMPFPSIVRLSVFVRIPFKHIVLSRKNIIRRDGNRCQYCGRSDAPMTIDHIVPKAKGGRDTWENLVTACTKCNNKKGDRTPQESHMTLIRKPFKPNHLLFIRDFVGSVDERWKPYLFLS